MRVIAQYVPAETPPLVRFWIHGAPHRRMMRLDDGRVNFVLITAYRAMLVAACRKIGLHTPIDHPIDLSVVFVDPTSPDLGNLYLALEMSMDGGKLHRDSVLMDDSLVHGVRMMKLSPNVRVEREVTIIPLRAVIDNLTGGHREHGDRLHIGTIPSLM